MLWTLLVSFVLRLAFGLSMAMAWTPSKLVTSGFFRIHLWVVLGLNTFAAMAIVTGSIPVPGLLPACLAAAVTSYLGAVLWLYEKPGVGKAAIYLAAFFDLTAAFLVASLGEDASVRVTLSLHDIFSITTSGLLLGLTTASMLLGHWYLNTPSMQLGPLRQLIIALAVTVAVRALVCGTGLAQELALRDVVQLGWCGLLSLRWLAGLVGVACLAWMTWQTLKIPNTQSATGILYVAVIFSFLGELSSLLLHSTSTWPL